ncbi:MAG: hypothetical protein OEY85_15715 [Rhodospirillales bacterium]|nr:hypothetical protein [Rhodospirillales bacterium]
MTKTVTGQHSNETAISRGMRHVLWYMNRLTTGSVDRSGDIPGLKIDLKITDVDANTFREARKKLSTLLENAMLRPQIINVRGKGEFVIMPSPTLETLVEHAERLEPQRTETPITTLLLAINDGAETDAVPIVRRGQRMEDFKTTEIVEPEISR